MFVNVLVPLAVLAAMIAIASFVLYGRARMKEQAAREKRYLQLHYTALFILLLLGIVYMFYMVETAG